MFQRQIKENLAGRGEEWNYENLPLSNNRGALVPKVTNFLIPSKPRRVLTQIAFYIFALVCLTMVNEGGCYFRTY